MLLQIYKTQIRPYLHSSKLVIIQMTYMFFLTLKLEPQAINTEGFLKLSLNRIKISYW